MHFNNQLYHSLNIHSMNRIILIILAIAIFSSCKSNRNKEIKDSKKGAIQEQKQTSNTKTSVDAAEENPSKTLEINEKSKELEPKQEKSTPTIIQDSSLFSLVVSFYSIGEGIDFKVAKEYNQLLSSYTNSDGILLDFDKVSWGREGETDFCIRLNSYSKKEKEKFLEKSQEILKKTELVHTKENASCRQKRVR